jgi:uncharacterized membrane protein YczE
MNFFKKLGKWVVIFYVAQALIGLAVGVYLGATIGPDEIERIVSCVTH